MKFLLPVFLLLSFLKANEELPLHLLPHNCNVGKKAASSHGHHGRGMKTAMYQLVGYNGSFKSDAKYYLSNKEIKQLKMEANMVNLPRSMYSNYHALVVNASKENNYYTSVYYLYKFGKPSKTSPLELTFRDKGAFEFIPNHLPREHDRYYGSKTYNFILKYKGEPLANQAVTLTTLQDTVEQYFTNQDGEVSIVLPDDFEDVKVGKRANLPSYFILSSSYQDGKNTYHSTFSNPYHVNPHDYWSSTPAGTVVAIVGFVMGLLILWRRKNG